MEQYQKEWHQYLAERDAAYGKEKTEEERQAIENASLLLSIYMLSYKNRDSYFYSPATLPSMINLYNIQVIAGDGQFLGNVSNILDRDSILNQLGTYGSRYSYDSIWNNLSPYGSKFSGLSAFNPIAADPPRIYMNGILIGYLTTNPLFLNRINPYLLLKK